MEKVKKSQSQGGSSNSASQHFVGRGVSYDYIEYASVTQASGVLIKFVQTFAENYFKFRVCILGDHDYLILQSLPFLSIVLIINIICLTALGRSQPVVQA